MNWGKGIYGVLLGTCLLSGGLQAQTTATFTWTGFPAPIAPASSNLITLAQIPVPQALSITKVTASVQISYPNTGDLYVYLYSPQGTRTVLLQHDCAIPNVNTTFDDGAQSLWKDFCPTEAGRGPFRPDQPLSNFNADTSSFGIWYIAVQNDQSNSRSGYITSFSITITGNTQLSPITRTAQIVNAASLSGAGTVAPGEVVSIFGSALGPTPPVQAPAGALPSTLGGSTVTVNGVTAPLLYASAFRVDAQMPFNLTGTSANVAVNSSSGSSPAVSVPIVSAVPGLYTTAFGGAGQVNAVNQDGTLNSVGHGAPKGSYLTMYANGLGIVTPALVEGAVPPSSPLSNVAGTVAAYIGGVPATVQFAGAAPGYPGLYQLNLQVPASAQSGTRVIEIYVNGQQSQAATTVQIQ
jgi:uncharacterized protein (TIGR03437 family)